MPPAELTISIPIKVKNAEMVSNWTRSLAHFRDGGVEISSDDIDDSSPRDIKVILAAIHVGLLEVEGSLFGEEEN